MGSEKMDGNAAEAKAAADAKDFNPLPMVAAVFGLLIIALLISFLSQFLKHSQPAAMEENATGTQFTGNASSYYTNLTYSNLNTSNASIQMAKCNRTLLSGNEKDSYSYSSKYAYPGMPLQTSITTANFSKSETGFVKRVVTAMQDRSMVMTIQYNDTMGCTKVETTVKVGDQTYSQESPCMKNAGDIEVCADYVAKAGDERITVGAGTFDTAVYATLDNSTRYWIDNMSSVLVPIRIASENFTMDLVDYEKWEG